ncbi:MAG: hypothetical protein ACREBT_06720 [Thermoplasmata archaeon]
MNECGLVASATVCTSVVSAEHVAELPEYKVAVKGFVPPLHVTLNVTL